MHNVLKFCPQCGTPVTTDQQSCSQCGSRFDDRFRELTELQQGTDQLGEAKLESVEAHVRPTRSWKSTSVGMARLLSYRYARITPKNFIKRIVGGLGLFLLLMLVSGGITGDQLPTSSANHTDVAYAQQGTSHTVTMQQAQKQAQQALQNFQLALSQKGAQNYSNIQAFSQRFSQDETLLTTAHTTQQYVALREDTQTYLRKLNVIEKTYNQMSDFGTMLTSLQMAQIDTTALQTQYQNDQQQYNHAQHINDFMKLNTLVTAQKQLAEVETVQTFPYTSTLQLRELQTQINSLKTYGIDVSQYQTQYTAAQSALAGAKSIQKDMAFSNLVEAELNALQVPLLQGEAHYLVNEYHQEVNAWANANPYVDKYNGQTYALDVGYMNVGIGAKLDSDLAGASTADEYNIVIQQANDDLFNLHMFEADYHDQTPYDQVHATDLQLFNHYHLQSGQVLMVSLSEQSMRVYQNGKLVRSFYVTTGQPAKPALPGVWSVLSRQSPMTFTSGEPKSSPLWFPDTPIKYGIMYHYGGFFVHDAWWRTVFGPGTQFPHLDAGGTLYAQTGSHGCINLSTSDAGWVYSQTNWNTTIVVY
jgi:hypothetical protein